MKKALSLVLASVLGTAGLLAGCASSPKTASSSESVSALEGSSAVSAPQASSEEKEPVTILVAAAASLEYSFTDELIPMFQEKYPWITVEGSYDSSGKLQTQIEEGLEADVFMSAATKQMDSLVESGHVDSNSVVDLLENEIVLIAPADSTTKVTSFEEIGKAESIAIGDPASVPAGQYAQEALESLGLWEEIQPKVSLGTNVTEVLTAVEESSAEVGIVYATDAATTEKVKVLAIAPEGSLAKKVIYPVGVLTDTKNAQAASLFVEFLATPEAIKVFEKYGFIAA